MSWRKPVRLLVRRIARRRGYDVVEYPGTSFRRRLKLMRHFQVDLVLDIGADTGEYVAKLRRYGYEGWVVSFEPLPSSFAELRYNAGTDPLWETANFALGERDGRAALHIAGNAHSSSLHDMLPAHVEAAPQSAYVDAEEVDVGLDQPQQLVRFSVNEKTDGVANGFVLLVLELECLHVPLSGRAIDKGTHEVALVAEQVNACGWVIG